MRLDLVDLRLKDTKILNYKVFESSLCIDMSVCDEEM